MKNRYLVVLFVLIILVNIFLLKYKDKESIDNKPFISEEHKEEFNETCITLKSIKEVRNNSMEPMIKAGEEFILLEGYYKCNDVERGDVVAYDFSANDVPLIKKVLVLGGDILEIKDSNLLVNNAILKNSTGEPYVLDEQNKKMINLYIVEGKMRLDAYLIFGDNNSSKDSRKFGAVGKEGFIGKFDIK
jgi:signal peptidase I